MRKSLRVLTEPLLLGTLVIVMLSGFIAVANFVRGEGQQTGSNVGIVASSPETVPLATRVLPPRSFDELARIADLVALGTVVGVIEEADEGAYNASDIPARAAGSPALPTFRVTYYEVLLTEVIASAEGLQPGNSVVLRVDGSLSADNHRVMPHVGDRRLFFVGLNPDGQSYGPTTGSIVDVRGPTPRFAWIERGELDFLGERGRSDQLIEDLRAAGSGLLRSGDQ